MRTSAIAASQFLILLSNHGVHSLVLPLQRSFRFSSVPPTNQPADRIMPASIRCSPTQRFRHAASNGDAMNENKSEEKSSEAKEVPSDAYLNDLRGRLFLRDILRNFFKGITLPFPSLRQMVLYPRSPKDRAISVGWSLREGITALLSYLLIGSLAYHVFLEKWSVVDAVYFSCVCFSTVGFGDLVPSTAISRLFTTLFGIGGIVFLGAAVATVGSSFVQAEVEAVKKARTASRRRIMHLFEGMPKVLESIKSNVTKKPGQREPLLKARERARRRESKSEIIYDSVVGVLKRVLPSMLTIFGGGILMGYLNGGWTFVESVYFALVTASTIGFGDLSPQTQSARLFAIFYIPLAVAAAGDLLSAVALELVQRRQKRLYEEQLEKDLTIKHLQAMDADGDGKITPAEYVEFMLIEMGRVDHSELKELYRQFDRLDVTDSGYLDNEDLRMMARLNGANIID